MTFAIRPAAPAVPHEHAEQVAMRSRVRLLNAQIDAAHRRYRHLSAARTMTPGEKALNTAAAAFPDKLLVMHANADGEYVRLDVVDGGTVLASVVSSEWREVNNAAISPLKQRRAESMAEKAERPQLGEWRTITTLALRRTEHKRTDTRGVKRLRLWVKSACWRKASPAMYIGYRTVADGETEWIEGVGYVFTPHSHKELWLFVSDARTSPFHAFPEDVLPLDAAAK